MKFAFHASEVVRNTVKFVLRTSEVDFARRQNQLFGQRPHSFAKALVVDNLALAEEFDNVVDVGIVTEAQDVIVGNPCLLLGGEVLVEVGKGISL